MVRFFIKLWNRLRAWSLYHVIEAEQRKIAHIDVELADGLQHAEVIAQQIAWRVRTSVERERQKLGHARDLAVARINHLAQHAHLFRHGTPIPAVSTDHDPGSESTTDIGEEARLS